MSMSEMDCSRTNREFLEQFTYEVEVALPLGHLAIHLPKGERELACAVLYGLVRTANALYHDDSRWEHEVVIDRLNSQPAPEFRPAGRNVSVRLANYSPIQMPKFYRPVLNAESHRTITVVNRNKFEDRLMLRYKAGDTIDEYRRIPTDIFEVMLTSVDLPKESEEFRRTACTS